MNFQRIRQWSEVGAVVIQEAWNSFYDSRDFGRVAEESDMSEEFVKNHRRMQSTAALSMSRSDTDFRAGQKRS